MTVYSAQIASANRLISQKGAACTLTRRVGVSDAAQPWKPNAAEVDPTEYVGAIVLFPISLSAPEALGIARTAVAKETRLIGYFSSIEANADGVKELDLSTDTIVIGSETLALVSTAALNPDSDLPIIHIVQVA